MSQHPRLLWVTDPWETLDHPRDTSLRLLEESLRLGINSWWCDVKTIRWEKGHVQVTAAEAKAVKTGRGAADFEFAPPQAIEPSHFTRILYRTDPPVDLAYLHPLQLLTMSSGGAEIISPPAVLFMANEKLEAAALGDLMPPTVVSSRWEALAAFAQAEGKVVLKPLHLAQSKGVALLDWSSGLNISAASEVIRAATEEFRQPILLQRYLPGILEGEQRLWFLNGKLLAVARKLPRKGEFRIDMDAGGTLAATQLDSREKHAADRIGKHLRVRRIRMAAVDLIEGFVTDFNFTSPGLLTPMEKLLGENLAEPVVKSLAVDWT